MFYRTVYSLTTASIGIRIAGFCPTRKPRGPTANIQLASGKAMKAVRKDVASRRNGWLLEASKVMTDSVIADYEDWRKGHS